MPGHDSAVTATPASMAAAASASVSLAERVVLPRREVERGQARQVGVGRATAGGRRGATRPAAYSRPRLRTHSALQEGVATGSAHLATGSATDTSNQPEMERKQAGGASPVVAGRRGARPSPSSPPHESPLTTRCAGSTPPSASSPR